jgi:hypothetical protein
VSLNGGCCACSPFIAQDIVNVNVGVGLLIRNDDFMFEILSLFLSFFSSSVLLLPLYSLHVFSTVYSLSFCVLSSTMLENLFLCSSFFIRFRLYCIMCCMIDSQAMKKKK